MNFCNFCRATAVIFFIAALLFYAGESISEESELRENYRSGIGKCFIEASQTYRVSVWLLWGIAKVESNFNPRAIRKNRNGSYDVGLMQINTVWLSELKKYGITLQDLFDPCVNVKVGAWILAQCIRDYGYTWRAVGCYHSRNVKRGMKYAGRVRKVIAMEMKRKEMKAGGKL